MFKKTPSLSEFLWDSESGVKILVLNVGEYRLMWGSTSLFVSGIMDKSKLRARLSQVSTLADFLSGLTTLEFMGIYASHSPVNVPKDLRILESVQKQMHDAKSHILGEQSHIDHIKQSMSPYQDIRLRYKQSSRIERAEERIREYKSGLGGLEKLKIVEDEIIDQLNRKSGGFSLLFLATSSYHLVKLEQVTETAEQILNELKGAVKSVKLQLSVGMGLELKTCFDPYLINCFGLFPDPLKLTVLYEKYPLPELKNLIDSCTENFIPKLREDVVFRGSKIHRRSSSIAQAVAGFVRRDLVVQNELREEKEPLFLPDFKKMPDPRRPIYSGLVCGEDFETVDFPYVFDLDKQLRRHIVGVGVTGSGKSTSIRILAEGVYLNNIPLLIIDSKRSLTGLLKPCEDPEMLSRYRKFYLDKKRDSMGLNLKIYTPNSNEGLDLKPNLLACPKIQDPAIMDDLTKATANIVNRLCKLDGKEKILFLFTLTLCWKKGVDLDSRNIMDAVQQIGEVVGLESKGLCLKLSILLDSHSFLFSGRGFELSDLWNSIICLKYLSETQKAYFMWYVVRELLAYATHLPESRELKLFTIIDDFHILSNKTNPSIPEEVDLIVERLVKLLRDKGVGFGLFSNDLTDFYPGIRGNCGTKIQFCAGDSTEAGRIKQIFGQEYSKLSTELPVGSALVKFNEYNSGKPVLVSFRPTLTDPKELSIEEVGKYMNGYRKEDSFKEQISNIINSERRSQKDFPSSVDGEVNESEEKIKDDNGKISPNPNTKENELEQKFKDVLVEIREKTGEYPTVSEIQKATNWSWRTLEKIKESLLDKGKILIFEENGKKRIRPLDGSP